MGYWPTAHLFYGFSVKEEEKPDDSEDLYQAARKAGLELVMSGCMISGEVDLHIAYVHESQSWDFASDINETISKYANHPSKFRAEAIEKLLDFAYKNNLTVDAAAVGWKLVADYG